MCEERQEKNHSLEKGAAELEKIKAETEKALAEAEGQRQSNEHARNPLARWIQPVGTIVVAVLGIAATYAISMSKLETAEVAADRAGAAKENALRDRNKTTQDLDNLIIELADAIRGTESLANDVEDAETQEVQMVATEGLQQLLKQFEARQRQAQRLRDELPDPHVECAHEMPSCSSVRIVVAVTRGLERAYYEARMSGGQGSASRGRFEDLASTATVEVDLGQCPEGKHDILFTLRPRSNWGEINGCEDLVLEF